MTLTVMETEQNNNNSKKNNSNKLWNNDNSTVSWQSMTMKKQRH